MARRTKVQVGDVVEIATAKGRAYAQVSHIHWSLGTLLRVLPGWFQERPQDLEALVQQKETYVTFVPADFGIEEGLFVPVGRYAVPPEAARLPLFRRADAFALWDGERLLPLETLDPDSVSKLPLDSLVHPVLFVERLEGGWTPATNDEYYERVRREAAASGSDALAALPDRAPEARHFLYFPTAREARRAAKAVAARGHTHEVRRSADGEQWLLLVTESAAAGREHFETARAELEDIASAHGGEYDGWEIDADQLRSRRLS